MKPLPVEFDRKGWHFKQLKREGMIAIYLRTKPGEHTLIESYEVIEIITEPDKFRFGKSIPVHERYPGDEEWGKYGWTYRSLSGAQSKFKRLVFVQPESKPAVFICGEGDDSGNEAKRLVA